MMANGRSNFHRLCQSLCLSCTDFDTKSSFQLYFFCWIFSVLRRIFIGLMTFTATLCKKLIIYSYYWKFSKLIENRYHNDKKQRFFGKFNANAYIVNERQKIYYNIGDINDSAKKKCLHIFVNLCSPYEQCVPCENHIFWHFKLVWLSKKH